MDRLNRRLVAFGLGIVVVMIVVAAGSALRAGATENAPQEVDFATNRAHLTIDARRVAADRAEVRVTFSPTVADGHLYGMAMPRTGIDGAGRPTLVDLVGPDWSVGGPVAASATTEDRHLPGFSAAFPLYPDGPVTLTVPIVRASGSSGDPPPARLALTFMVCTSSGVCFPPVERAEVEVPVL